MAKRGKKNSKKVYNNRLLYSLIALGVLIIAAVGVYAANSLLTPGVAPNPGHTISQTAPPSGCTAGQVLEWNGTSNANGGWSCTNALGSVAGPTTLSGDLDVNGGLTVGGAVNISGVITYPYGGMFFKDYSSGNCLVINPYTKACSCPSGYTTTGTVLSGMNGNSNIALSVCIPSSTYNYGYFDCSNQCDTSLTSAPTCGAQSISSTSDTGCISVSELNGNICKGITATCAYTIGSPSSGGTSTVYQTISNSTTCGTATGYTPCPTFSKSECPTRTMSSCKVLA